MDEALLAETQADAAAVTNVLAGDKDAFASIAERHQGRVYGLCLRMLGTEAEALDAAQDAFVLAYTRLRSFDPAYKFKSWLMTIASNHCIDLLRRRKIEPASFADLATEVDPEPAERIASAEPTPEEAFERDDRRDAVLRMLHDLDSRDRAMVVQYFWADMSYEEIAGANKTTVSAVKSRLFRARRMMAASKQARMLME